MAQEELSETELLTPGREKKQPRLFPSFRLTICVLSALGMFVSALSQASMGAAMVYIITNVSDNQTSEEAFDWDKRTQGWILGCRFLAYYLCQLPSGFLKSYMTSRMMAAIGLFTMGTFDVMTVPCAYYKDLWLLYLVRSVQGAGNVLITTACYDIAGKWAPKHESSLLAGLIGTGYVSGASVVFLTTSSLCENPSLGWPFIFYFTGGLSLVFSAVWCVFADEQPSVSRWVGQEERDFIVECKKDDIFHGKTPWRAMARSGPVYGIALAQISGDCLTYFCLTVAPTYWTTILHMRERHAQLVCGIPFLLIIPTSILSGRFLDFLRLKRVVSTIGARRLSQGIATLGPAACCLLLALLPASQTEAAATTYALLVLSFIGQTTGWFANLTDLAPQLTGPTSTLSQTLAVWTGFAMPVVVDYMTVHNTKEEWNTVFYIIATIQVVSFGGFCILASGDVQPWAKSQEQPHSDDYELVSTSDHS